MESTITNSITFFILLITKRITFLFPIVLAIAALEFCVGKLARRWTSRSVKTDLGYLLISTFYAPFLRHFLTLIFALFAIDSAWLSPHPSILREYGVFVQILVLLFARDLFIYLRHRIFHTRRLWRFHAIHHSSKEVNWLSTARFHPVESLIEATLDILLFLSLSPERDAIIIASTIMGFNDFFVHSDCAIRYGPLNKLLVSPVYHRWHHSTDQAALNKNFAAMFSFLDVLGGTYYMPHDRLPEKTGVSDKLKVPETFWGQILYPFRGG